VARDTSSGGGLGLMRIAYEASCALTATVEGNMISVRAQLDIPPEVAAGLSPH
jgi:hypothetical protein